MDLDIGDNVDWAVSVMLKIFKQNFTTTASLDLSSFYNSVLQKKYFCFELERDRKTLVGLYFWIDIDLQL